MSLILAILQHCEKNTKFVLILSFYKKGNMPASRQKTSDTEWDTTPNQGNKKICTLICRFYQHLGAD
ncbi:hypothetical protein BKG97_04550 [Rodentibacter caecimuris]|nr:hypothetical protein BKG97_04550 [Rodentibacter heylii]